MSSEDEVDWSAFNAGKTPGLYATPSMKTDQVFAINEKLLEYWKRDANRANQLHEEKEEAVLELIQSKQTNARLGQEKEQLKQDTGLLIRGFSHMALGKVPPAVQNIIDKHKKKLSDDSDIANASDLLRFLFDTNHALRTQLDNDRQITLAARDEVKALDRTKMKLQAKLDRLQQEAGAGNAVVAAVDLEAKLKMNSEEISKLKMDVSTAQAEVQQKSDEINRIREEASAVRAVVQKQDNSINALKEDLTTTRAELEAKSDEISKLKQETLDSQAEVTSVVDQRVDELKEELAAISKLNQDTSDYRARLVTVTDRMVEEFNFRVAILEQQIRTVNRQTPNAIKEKVNQSLDQAAQSHWKSLGKATWAECAPAAWEDLQKFLLENFGDEIQLPTWDWIQQSAESGTSATADTTGHQ